MERISDKSVEEIIADQQGFYERHFGIKGNLYCPLPPFRTGFGRIIVVPPGMTWDKALDVFRKKFRTEFFLIDSGNILSAKNDREGEAAYAIRIRGEKEADGCLNGLSGNELRKRKISGMTATEYLVFHLMHLEESGEHPDCEHITMCSGSIAKLDLGGKQEDVMPCICWDQVKNALVIDWCSLDNVDGQIMGREVLLL